MAKFKWYEIYCQDPRGLKVDWAARAADASGELHSETNDDWPRPFKYCIYDT